jgi:hypothetical protein
VFREISVLSSTVIEGNTVKRLISKGFDVVIDFSCAELHFVTVLTQNAGLTSYALPPVGKIGKMIIVM